MSESTLIGDCQVSLLMFNLVIHCAQTSTNRK